MVDRGFNLDKVQASVAFPSVKGHLGYVKVICWFGTLKVVESYFAPKVLGKWTRGQRQSEDDLITTLQLHYHCPGVDAIQISGRIEAHLLEVSNLGRTKARRSEGHMGKSER